MAEVVVDYGGKEILRVPLKGASVTIGRDPQCDLHLDNRALSRRHALIEKRGAAIWVKDLKSQNGTFVNGERVTDAGQALNGGDTIEVGRYQVRIEGVEAARTDTPVLTLTGPEGRHRFAMVGDEIILGRAPSCDIAIGHKSISRRHLRVAMESGQFIAEDLGSQNGTRINNRRINGPTPFKIGDKVRFKLHPLGTDYLGRDMLARLMHGARVSLFIGIVAPLLFVGFGVAYGSMAGFLGGRVDQIMMRFADFVIALPFLLFMILFKIAFGIGPGQSGILPMIVALVMLSWPGTARLVRGQILQVREEGYVNAARLLGARTNYLVMRHMIPNTMGVILVTLTFAVPSAIFTEAFLSFIGMGVAPPTPSWGGMSNEGIKSMLIHPHELLFPAVLISITVLAFNLLGDGLRDALDAKMRSRE